MAEEKKPVDVSNLEGTIRFGPFVFRFAKEKSPPIQAAQDEIIRLRQRLEEAEATIEKQAAEIERLKGQPPS